MLNPFPDRLQKYLDVIPEFHVFLGKIRAIEDNMTNRVPKNLGIPCRWLKVRQKSREIHCEYGQGEPGLLYCLQCAGCLFNDGIINERFKEMDHYSRYIKPSETSDIESLKKFNKQLYLEREAKLLDYLKEELAEKLVLLGKFENGEEIDFCE